MHVCLSVVLWLRVWVHVSLWSPASASHLAACSAPHREDAGMLFYSHCGKFQQEIRKKTTLNQSCDSIFFLLCVPCFVKSVICKHVSVRGVTVGHCEGQNLTLQNRETATKSRFVLSSLALTLNADLLWILPLDIILSSSHVSTEWVPQISLIIYFTMSVLSPG